MRTDLENGIENKAETLIFNAAFDGGTEQLIRLQSPNEPQFVLRKNLYIDDVDGNVIWNETQHPFRSVSEYLSEIKSRIVNYTPIELHPDYAGKFKSTLLAGLRIISQQEELAFLGAGNGFNRWMRWAKHFQDSRKSETTSISLYAFGKATPVSQIKIDLHMIANFQQLLDNAYISFLMNTYRPGRFGKDWSLYNLNRCLRFDTAPRNARPSENFLNVGDDLAVLRLSPA